MPTLIPRRQRQTDHLSQDAHRPRTKAPDARELRQQSRKQRLKEIDVVKRAWKKPWFTSLQCATKNDARSQSLTLKTGQQTFTDADTVFPDRNSCQATISPLRLGHYGFLNQPAPSWIPAPSLIRTS